MFCPNLKNKQVNAEFSEIVSAVGENAAFKAWSENGGFPMELTLPAEALYARRQGVVLEKEGLKELSDFVLHNSIYVPDHLFGNNMKDEIFGIIRNSIYDLTRIDLFEVFPNYSESLSETMNAVSNIVDNMMENAVQKELDKNIKELQEDPNSYYVKSRIETLTPLLRLSKTKNGRESIKNSLNEIIQNLNLGFKDTYEEARRQAIGVFDSASVDFADGLDKMRPDTKEYLNEIFGELDENNPDGVLASVNANKVLEKLKEGNSNFKKTAELFGNFLSDHNIPVQLVRRARSDSGRDVLGTFHSTGLKSGVIQISIETNSTIDQIQSTIIHESAHAATVTYLYNNADANSAIEAYMDILKEHLLGGTYHKPGILKYYAFKNSEEFVAEFFGNNGFREFLKRTAPIENKKFKNIFEEFWNKILSLFVSDMNNESAFTQISDVMDELMRESYTFLNYNYDKFGNVPKSSMENYTPVKSRLFEDLLTRFGGNREMAIKGKVLTFSESFMADENVYVDENGEPSVNEVLPFLPEVPLYKEFNSEKLDINNAKNAINSILENGSEHEKEVAKTFQDTANELDDISIEFIDSIQEVDKSAEKGAVAAYDAETGTIYVSKSIPTYSELTYNQVILHELTHAFTLQQIAANTKDSQALNEIYKEYKKNFSDYAASSLTEFASEVFSNPRTLENLDRIEKNDTTLLNKLMDFIKRLFGKRNPSLSQQSLEAVENMILETTASKKLISNITHDIPRWHYVRDTGEFYDNKYAAERINNHINSITMSIDRLNTSMPYSRITDEFDAKIQKFASDSRMSFDNIIRATGSNALLVMQSQLEAAHDYLTRLNDTVADANNVMTRMEELYKEYQNTKNKKTYNALLTMAKDLDANYISGNLFTLEQLYATLTDENVSMTYSQILGKNAISDFTNVTGTMLNYLGHRKDPNSEHLNLGFRFSNLVSKLIAEFLIDQMEAVGDPTVSAKIKDLFLFSEGDMSALFKYIGTVAAESTELKILRRLSDNNNFRINREVAKIEPYLRKAAQKKIKKKLLFETDLKGRRTGNFVQERRYGLWENEKREWKFAWYKKNGVLSYQDLRKDADKHRQYQMDLVEFTAKNVEKKYIPEFYRVFAKLSPLTQQALADQDAKIEEITRMYLDEKGRTMFHKMSDEDYAQWKRRVDEKRALASKWDRSTGEDKVIGSHARMIADELTELYDVLKLNLDSEIDYDAFREEAKRIKAESVLPSDYQTWYDRNTETRFTKEFEDLVELNNSAEQLDPNNPVHAVYKNLREQRSEMLRMYRTIDGYNDFISMPEVFKETIRELDHMIERYKELILAENPKALKRPLKLFTASVSPFFKERKQKYGYDDSNDFYIDSNGKKRYYSYVLSVEPINKKKYTEIVPNRNWRETSSEARYFNPKYDPSIPYSEQPKLEIPKYDSRKQYQEMRNDKNTSELYDLLIKVQEEAVNVLGIDESAIHRMPQKRGSMANYMQAKGIVRGFLQSARDALMISEDDPNYNRTPSVMPDGSPIDNVPMFYVAPLLDPSIITGDIVGSVLDFYEMAMSYKIKGETAPIISLYSRELYKKGLVASGDDVGVPTNKASGSNVLERFDKMVDVLWYSRPKKPTEFKVRGNLLKRAWNFAKGKENIDDTEQQKSLYVDRALSSQTGDWSNTPQRQGLKEFKVSTDKIMSLLYQYNRLLKLGWKLVSAFGGAGAAINFFAGESISNNNISNRDLWTGIKDVIKSFFQSGTYTQLGKGGVDHKLYGMMQYNAITLHPREDRKNLTRSRVGRILVNSTGGFAVWTGAALFTNSIYLRAVYNAYRLVTLENGERQFMTAEQYYNTIGRNDKTFETFHNKGNQRAKFSQKEKHFKSLNPISLWDAYNFNKDMGIMEIKSEYADAVTQQLELDIHALISYIVNHAEGNIAQSDKGLLYHNIFASAAAMFRNYLPGFIENALAGFHFGDRGRIAKRKTGSNSEMFYNHQTRQLEMGGFAAINIAVKIGVEMEMFHLFRILRDTTKKLTGRPIKEHKVKENHPFMVNARQQFNIENPEEIVKKYADRYTAQFSMWMVAALLFTFMKNMDPDEDNWVAGMAKWIAFRNELETGSRFNIHDIFNMFNSVAAITKTFDDFLHFFNIILSPEGSEIIKHGKYAGSSKRFRAFIRLIPQSNIYYNFKDPHQSLDDMQKAIRDQ